MQCEALAAWQCVSEAPRAPLIMLMVSMPLPPGSGSERSRRRRNLTCSVSRRHRRRPSRWAGWGAFRRISETSLKSDEIAQALLEATENRTSRCDSSNLRDRPWPTGTKRISLTKNLLPQQASLFDDAGDKFPHLPLRGATDLVRADVRLLLCSHHSLQLHGCSKRRENLNSRTAQRAAAYGGCP